MKTKNGKVVLAANDVRVGNFVFSKFTDSVRVQDISSTIILEVSRRTMIGRLVTDALDEYNTGFLGNYAAMAYLVNGTVPDVQFWQDMNDVITRCLERHPELYGQKLDVSPEEEAKILSEEKELHDSIAELSGEEETEA